MTMEPVLTCPYCRAPFDPADTEDPPMACPACGTTHHTACFAENAGCTVFGCSQAPVEQPKISVTNQDIVQPPSAPPPPTTRIPVPPPPRLPNAMATPPAMFGNTGPAQAPAPAPMPNFAFGGYASTPASFITPSGYVVHKNRVAYVMLAIFFGALGIHNFYAGYIKKAVVQCCITVFTAFLASPVIWIWAIVEACTVNRDGDDVLFT
jgi:TM2 domain-containing membrane protein YozV